MSFSSLTELLVAFIDYVLIHYNAIDKAKVLHRDISLLNLLLTSWDRSRKAHRLDFLNDLAPETHMCLQSQMKDITYHSFLTDWGYAVPLDIPHTPAELLAYQAASGSAPSTPACNLPPTSPILLPSNQPSELGDNSVPVRISVPSNDQD
ncbi:hypothetical protein OG21DRAFT_1489573 [Imleria badia]|nr:hypothetical protein OG21DRAFT_1489573 [Imleria badia]